MRPEPAAAAPGADQSAAGMPDGSDSDDNSADFQVTATPTPRAVNG